MTRFMDDFRDVIRFVNLILKLMNFQNDGIACLTEALVIILEIPYVHN